MYAEKLKSLVENIRMAQEAMVYRGHALGSKEKQNKIFRRSLFVVKDVKKGERFSEENIKSIRPAYGMSPKFIKSIIGKKAKKNIKRGIPIRVGLISNQ